METYPGHKLYTTDRMSNRHFISITAGIDGVATLPKRLALAALSPKRRWWIFLFVLVPIGLLIASLQIDQDFANILVGTCAFLILVLWGTSYYNFSRLCVRIDTKGEELTTVHGNASYLERTVDLNTIDSISVTVLSSTALIRIDEHRLSWIERFTLSDPFPVPRDQLPEVLGLLHTVGVTVPETTRGDIDGGSGGSIEPFVRLTVTPLVLIGVPIFGIVLFGPGIVLTNGTIMALVLGLMATVQELR